ncbi:MAG: hypothetical protein H7246_00190, partial [Phycisphaerae bacterium]|nr:hypothetical protein [Saprospiraceae bacterium]
MKKITSLLIASCFVISAIAQNLSTCPEGTVFVDDCASACIPCDIQNPFNIHNGSFTLDVPFSDCLWSHNNMWLAFRALESTVTFTAAPTNCDRPGGIQMAVYQTCNTPCIDFDYGCDEEPVSVTLNGLIIGNTYYMVIDGCDGAVCDVELTIEPLSAVVEPDVNSVGPLRGRSDVCTNGIYNYCIEPVSGADNYEWNVPSDVLVNGIPGPTVFLPAPGGNCAEITLGPTLGSSEICVRSLSVCRQGIFRCISVTAEEFLETIFEPVLVCPEDAATYVLPWGGYISPTAGTKDYQQKLVTKNGCDSLVNISVTIPPIIFTNLQTQYLCPGKCIMVGGTSFCAPGNYNVKMTSSLGCDSNIIFSIATIGLQADITQADTLSCNAPIVTLNSSTQPNGIKTWTDASGLILGTEDTLAVTKPGIYYLMVTSNQGNFNCTLIDSVAIAGDTLAPSISLSADTLGCKANPALIQVTTDSISAAYLWTGPGGFSATVADTFVVLAGLYSVTVTNLENSCTNSASINVPINFVPPDLAIDISEQIDCQHPVVSLNAHSANAVTFAWTGPDGFVSQLQQPQVDNAGIYTVTVKDSSGCANIASITVSENLMPPVVSVAGDTLSCSQPTGVILASVQAGMATFAWSGPSGFTAVVPNPSVDLVGGYQVIATGANGCTAVAATTVVADLAVPDIAVSSGTLSCSVTKTTIHCSSSLPGLQVSWSGPGGFQSGLATDSVSLPGTYLATVLGANGCTATAAVTVTADVAVPDIYANGDTLTCANSTVLLNGGSATPGAGFNWSGPLNFSAAQEDVSIGNPGLYSLTVTDPANGCTALTTLNIEQDTVSPPVTAIAGMITCADTTALLQGISPVNGLVWQWTGPGNFVSTDQVAVAGTAGAYALVVTNPANGCTASVTATVQTDLIPPLINVAGIDTLTCSLLTLLLTGSSNGQVQWQWVFPGGSSLDTSEINVHVPGDYSLTATGSNGCTQSSTVYIAQDTVAPDLSASGDTLDCFGGLAALAGQSLTPGVFWSWAGPGNFASTLQNPSTSVPGVYTLSALAPNGCETAVTATVSENTSLPQVSISGTGTLNCSDTVVLLSASVSLNATGQWNTGESDTVLTVIAPGIYSFTATAANGCSRTATVEIFQDIEPPEDVHATEGQVNCSTPVISLYGSTATPNTSWIWAGPGNFYSTAQNPGNVTAPGLYTLIVLGTDNGCTASATCTVTADVAAPSAYAVADTITCLAAQVQIEASSMFDIASFHWTGPGNFTAAQEDPWVNLPGQYYLVVTATNGCTGTLEINILQDTALPGASAVGDTLSCIAPIGTLTGTSPAPGAVYLWDGPNSFQSSDPGPVTDQPGVYSLLVTGTNGCSSTAQALVVPDFAQPSIIADGGVLKCDVP